MKTIIVLAALIAAPLAAPLTANAEAPRGQIQVSTAGLDLRNPEDAATMIRRIETAVRPLCVTNPAYASTAGCIRIVTRSTVRNLRIPELKLALDRRLPASQG